MATHRKSKEAADKPRVEAVERALSILEAFADGSARLTLTEVATRTGFYPSTILRLFNSLERFGYLYRDPEGYFRLGPSLWRLGVLYQNSFDLERHVRPVLDSLAVSTGETAAFYVREGNRRICLYRRITTGSIGHQLEEGASLPLDKGASAHVLVAYSGGVGERYDTVRRERVCVSLGERNPDANAVAVPVFGEGDKFAGALSVTGPANRMHGAALDRCTALVRDGANALSRSLGGR